MSFESREVTYKFWLNPMTALGRYSASSDQETVDDFLGYYWFTENADSQRIEYQR
ncbi:hypothetical protein [Paraglaciecola sp. 25GB23A]|uniref:hypothetical protein n=1 Tax=Paraglaciecola sp. 25GB23A TaxID=3156068 RepID=UPI0032AED3CE